MELRKKEWAGTDGKGGKVYTVQIKQHGRWINLLNPGGSGTVFNTEKECDAYLKKLQPDAPVAQAAQTESKPAKSTEA